MALTRKVCSTTSPRAETARKARAREATRRTALSMPEEEKTETALGGTRLPETNGDTRERTRDSLGVYKYACSLRRVLPTLKTSPSPSPRGMKPTSRVY